MVYPNNTKNNMGLYTKKVVETDRGCSWCGDRYPYGKLFQFIPNRDGEGVILTNHYFCSSVCFSQFLPCVSSSINQMTTQTIQFSITKVRNPLNPKSGLWRETATRWLAVINGQEFDYYTGSLVAKEPSLDDVLSSLLLDADAIDLDFYSWCDEYGYTPSKESEFTYQSCLNNTRKLQKTGIDLQAEKLRLQDY